MDAFEHLTLGQKVIFGSGAARRHLAAEIARLQARRPLVIVSTRGRALAETVCGDLIGTAWFDDVRQHVPTENAEAARGAAAAHGADALVSVGGGSTTGLAKAVALTTGLPIIAVPTTYAGSEATNVWGLTEERTKTTGTDDRVLPTTVVYDATLTTSLPIGMSVASGLNGLAHCVDTLWAPKSDPINRALALEGARALGEALRTIPANPDDLDAREKAQYGCYLAAVAFGSAGSGLHHKICHVLGGTFDMPHAQTHAVVLPRVLALNAPAVPERADRLATALGGLNAVDALAELYAATDAPRRLADYGFTAGDIPEATRRILASAPPSNPVAVTTDNITALLTDALNGE
jgi:maleylacetate reductase